MSFEVNHYTQLINQYLEALPPIKTPSDHLIVQSIFRELNIPTETFSTIKSFSDEGLNVRLQGMRTIPSLIALKKLTNSQDYNIKSLAKKLINERLEKITKAIPQSLNERLRALETVLETKTLTPDQERQANKIYSDMEPELHLSFYEEMRKAYPKSFAFFDGKRKIL